MLFRSTLRHLYRFYGTWYDAARDGQWLDTGADRLSVVLCMGGDLYPARLCPPAFYEDRSRFWHKEETIDQISEVFNDPLLIGIIFTSHFKSKN